MHCEGTEDRATARLVPSRVADKLANGKEPRKMPGDLRLIIATN